MAWLSPKRSKLVHAARHSQILKFRQIWTRSRASAAIDAPHDPASKTQGYPGTDHTQGIPEQPEITRDCSILQNGRVHKVFGHMRGRNSGGESGIIKLGVCRHFLQRARRPPIRSRARRSSRRSRRTRSGRSGGPRSRRRGRPSATPRSATTSAKPSRRARRLAWRSAPACARRAGSCELTAGEGESDADGS